MEVGTKGTGLRDRKSTRLNSSHREDLMVAEQDDEVYPVFNGEDGWKLVPRAQS